MIKFEIPHRRLPAKDFINWVNAFTRDDSKRCRILLAELLLQLEGQWHNYWMVNSHPMLVVPGSGVGGEGGGQSARPLPRPAKSAATVSGRSPLAHLSGPFTKRRGKMMMGVKKAAK